MTSKGSTTVSEAQEAQRYRPNAPGVAHETVDGEVVIINLRTGDYYSCLGVAADAWHELAAGATATEVAAGLARAYAGDEAAVAADIHSFVAALCAEALLVPADGTSPNEALTFGGGVYEAPAFEKFSDMADLIVLDPVHNVTGEGWPHATDPT